MVHRFQLFTNQWGSRHCSSLPYYPQEHILPRMAGQGRAGRKISSGFPRDCQKILQLVSMCLTRHQSRNTRGSATLQDYAVEHLQNYYTGGTTQIIPMCENRATVLTHNRRFLRKRVPGSIPECWGGNNLPYQRHHYQGEIIMAQDTSEFVDRGPIMGPNTSGPHQNSYVCILIT